MMSLRAFFDAHLKIFQTMFEQTGQMTPQWVLQDATGKVEPIITPWGSDEKDAVLAFIRDRLEEQQIVRYIMVAEIWMAFGPIDGIPASERPDRQEHLMVSCEDRSGESISALAKIIRKNEEDKHPTLGDWEVMTNANYAGRFVNLFRKHSNVLH